MAIDTGSVDNDPAAETVRSAFTKVNTEIYGYRPWNVLGPPVGLTALAGNSNYSTATGTDDATALQAIINAAVASGGVPVVELPARRTYRIGSTITIPYGITIRGAGGRTDNGVGQQATIVWSGSDGGTMFNVSVAAANTPYVYLEDLCLMGQASIWSGGGSYTGLPATAINFNGDGMVSAVDTGTILRRCSLFNFKGSVVILEDGATNFLIDNGRIDNHVSVSGGESYAIKVVGAGSVTICGNFTWANPAVCSGFLFLDHETSGTGIFDVKLIGCHLETDNGDLIDTYAGGTNPCDKRGVIRLGVNASDGGVRTHVSAIGLRYDTATGRNSRSLFQITASSTADSDMDNTRMVNLQVIDGIGLSLGSTDANDGDEIRLVGGRLHANYRPPYTASGNVGHYQLNVGKNASGEIGWSQIASLRYYLRHPILQPMTVAQLDTSWPTEGMLGYVTDASAPTLGAIVAGGGSTHCLVCWTSQGTDGWKITHVFS